MIHYSFYISRPIHGWLLADCSTIILIKPNHQCSVIKPRPLAEKIHFSAGQYSLLKLSIGQVLNQEFLLVNANSFEQLVSQSATSSEAPPIVKRIIVELESGKHFRVRDYAKSLKINDRYLLRILRHWTDLTPKVILRIARIRRLIEMNGQYPDQDILQLAFDLGFYDQSHLSKECRALIGLKYSELCVQTYFQAKALGGLYLPTISSPPVNLHSIIIKPQLI